MRQSISNTFPGAGSAFKPRQKPIENDQLLNSSKKIAVLLKLLLANNSLRENVSMLVFRPEIFNRDKSPFPTNSRRKRYLISLCLLLLNELNGFLAKSIAPYLSSTMPTLDDPTLGITKNNTPLT